MSYSPSGLFPFGECRPPEWEAAIASSMLFPGIIWQHCHQPALFPSMASCGEGLEEGGFNLLRE